MRISIKTLLERVVSKPAGRGEQSRGVRKFAGKQLSPALFALLLTGMIWNTAAAQQRVYITNHCIDTVTVIDTATNNLVATITVGYGPYRVAFTPDGTRAYVPNYLADTVSVINTATNTVVATIPVGRLPYQVAVAPNGTRAYLTVGDSNNVSIINTADNTLIRHRRRRFSARNSVHAGRFAHLCGKFRLR